MKEINTWALALAKEGKYEGVFDLTSFQNRHPEYDLNMNIDRHIITLHGYHVIGKVQKECRFHPRQILISWQESLYNEYLSSPRA